MKPIQAHIADIVVPFQQAEAIQAQLLKVVPRPALELLVCAWHHDHLSYASPAKQKRYHQQERCDWRAFAEGLLDDQFDALKTLVFDQLDSIVRASSLVEMVNSFIRPYLHSCKGQLTQESLNLMMFYHNHRRYKSGKRKGKAPIELLTGKPLEADWIELFMHEGEGGQDATLEASLGSRPLLELVPCSHGGRVPSAAPPGQARCALTTDSENSQRQMDAEAA